MNEIVPSPLALSSGSLADHLAKMPAIKAVGETFINTLSQEMAAQPSPEVKEAPEPISSESVEDNERPRGELTHADKKSSSEDHVTDEKKLRERERADEKKKKDAARSENEKNGEKDTRVSSHQEPTQLSTQQIVFKTNEKLPKIDEQTLQHLFRVGESAAKVGVDYLGKKVKQEKAESPVETKELLQNLFERLSKKEDQKKEKPKASKDGGKEDQKANLTENTPVEKRNVSTREGVVQMKLDSEKWTVIGRIDAEKKELKTEQKIERPEVATGKKKEIPSIQQKGESQLFGHFNQQRESMPTSLSRLDNEKLLHENTKAFNELVEKAKVNLSSNGDSSATIRLKPEELGRITLNLKIQQNTVHATLLVETDAAREMIKTEIENLKSELKLQGLHVESLSIKTRDTSMFQQHSGNPFQDPNHENPSFQNEGQNQRSRQDERGAGSESQESNWGAIQEYEMSLPQEISEKSVNLTV